MNENRLAWVQARSSWGSLRIYSESGIGFGVGKVITVSGHGSTKVRVQVVESDLVAEVPVI